MSISVFDCTPPIALFILYLCVCVLSGIFIGAIGIGGVMLVPLLLLMDVPVAAANRAVLSSLLIAGIVCTVTNRHLLREVRRMAVRLCSAVLVGALVGALLFPLVPPLMTSAGMALLAVFAGAQALYKATRATQGTRAGGSTAGLAMADEAATSTKSANVTVPAPAPTTATAMMGPSAEPASNAARRSLSEVPLAIGGAGVIIGLLSVLTSTGGPFIALPVLMQLDPGLPPMLVVALSQTLAIPICLASTCVAAATPDGVDLGLALTIGVAVSLGVPTGARLSQRADPTHLKLAIGVLLLGVGISALWKTVARAQSESLLSR